MTGIVASISAIMRRRPLATSPVVTFERTTIFITGFSLPGLMGRYISQSAPWSRLSLRVSPTTPTTTDAAFTSITAGESSLSSEIKCFPIGSWLGHRCLARAELMMMARLVPETSEGTKNLPRSRRTPISLR